MFDAKIKVMSVYGPSGGAGLMAIVVIVLLLMGRL
jgi:Protein of unknown function (DUF3309)